MAESLATFVSRGTLKAKPKPAPKPGRDDWVKIGSATRKGVDQPTIWGGVKKAGWDPTTLPGMPPTPRPPKPKPSGSLAAMLGRR